MKISINNPCHENWDTMLPNEKGAFCLACQKTVVDFSSKSLDQIKDFFYKKQTSESVCGRFDDSQLTALSFDDFFTEFKSWKLVRKVALIVFFVFGLSLFSGAQTKSQPTIEVVPVPVMGAIAYIPPIDTTLKPDTKDTVYYNNTIKGKIKYVPEQPRKKPRPARKTMGEPEVDIRREK